MTEPLFWKISNLSYADTIKLQSSELVEHFQRDSRKNEVKFWPPSKGLLTHLKANLPEGASIVNEGVQTVTKEAVRGIKKPVVIHKSTGMDISDD